MKKQILLICTMFLPLLGQAQESARGAIANPLIENGPRFFVAIVAGVLLAFAFQIIMTMLSVAAGITAVGDIQKKVNNSSNDHHSSDSGDSNTGKKNICRNRRLDNGYFFNFIIFCQSSRREAKFGRS